MIMTFGKHKGKQLEEIPNSYLLWVLDNCGSISATLKSEIRKILFIEEQEPRQAWQQPRRETQTTIKKAITTDDLDQWYRRLARKYHPDRGGSNEAMKALLDGLDELKRMISKT